jgi:hypothetical protein
MNVSGRPDSKISRMVFAARLSDAGGAASCEGIDVGISLSMDEQTGEKAEGSGSFYVQPQGSRFRQPDNEVEQQARRPEHESQKQAGNHQPMRDAVGLRVAYLPAPDEEIERQIVNPSREKYPSIGKERCNLCQRTETATGSFSPVCYEQAGIENREQQWEDRARDQGCNPAPRSQDGQQQPSQKRDCVGEREYLFGGHSHSIMHERVRNRDRLGVDREAADLK